jgi:hypothetical protein
MEYLSCTEQEEIHILTVRFLNTVCTLIAKWTF